MWGAYSVQLSRGFRASGLSNLPKNDFLFLEILGSRGKHYQWVTIYMSLPSAELSS